MSRYKTGDVLGFRHRPRAGAPDKGKWRLEAGNLPEHLQRLILLRFIFDPVGLSPPCKEEEVRE